MKKYALIVGVSRYDDPEIGNLNFAAEDAREVGACLSKVCGFDEVRTLVSGGDHEPDHISVVKALHSFAPILNPEDLFLFYFAGHGIHTANGSYLLASNSLIRMPELAAVPMPLLQQCLSRLDAAERVLILDACRNDPHQGRGDAGNLLTQEFSRDILAVAKAPCEGVSPATCVLFSCSEGERAYEWPDKRHGAFTWYLLDGMRGAALDSQGRLTIQGLSRYVEEHVPRWSKKSGTPHAQTPWAQQIGSLREISLATAPQVSVRSAAPDCSETPINLNDQMEKTMSNPHYRSDVRIFETSGRSLQNIIGANTILLVTGTHQEAELFDRPVAERIRDAIDERGSGRFAARGLIISDYWLSRDQTLQNLSCISIGGSVINPLSQTIATCGKCWDFGPVRHGAWFQDGNAIKVAIWGDSATETQQAVEQYITAPEGLDAFLKQAWRD